MRDAGIVIAALFLPRLFERVDLLHERGFRDDAAAERGAHLLHYLGCGRRVSHEPDLALPRLLCGIDAARPLARDVGLRDDECAVVDGLLQALVEHWGALGSTTVDGLREGFLRREGLLAPTGEGWSLQVQARAIDLLLDRLPWSFATVRTPWMREVLHVQWR